MKWKTWGNENTKIRADFMYSVHRDTRGLWDAWHRAPMKRIGVQFQSEEKAIEACEAHAAAKRVS